MCKNLWKLILVYGTRSTGTACSQLPLLLDLIYYQSICGCASSHGNSTARFTHAECRNWMMFRSSHFFPLVRNYFRRSWIEGRNISIQRSLATWEKQWSVQTNTENLPLHAIQKTVDKDFLPCSHYCSVHYYGWCVGGVGVIPTKYKPQQPRSQDHAAT